jgi:hypothetical protein
MRICTGQLPGKTADQFSEGCQPLPFFASFIARLIEDSLQIRIIPDGNHTLGKPRPADHWGEDNSLLFVKRRTVNNTLSCNQWQYQDRA